jgi:SAM-dependent methyltransferase
MKEVKFITENHLSTNRNYLERVLNPNWPKHKAAEVAKRWDFDYWDGDRAINYGGYYYKPGYWRNVAIKIIDYYDLTNTSRILDVGCGKGFLLKEIMTLLPKINFCGLDISQYAIDNSHPDVKAFLQVGSAASLPYMDMDFDLVISINTLHNLFNFELYESLREVSRVARHAYICVESYRNEFEKANLLYWQVTCEAFNTPEEWQWWFKMTEYNGEYEFIYFE